MSQKIFCDLKWDLDLPSTNSRKGKIKNKKLEKLLNFSVFITMDHKNMITFLLGHNVENLKCGGCGIMLT